MGTAEYVPPELLIEHYSVKGYLIHTIKELWSKISFSSKKVGFMGAGVRVVSIAGGEISFQRGERLCFFSTYFTSAVFFSKRFVILFLHLPLPQICRFILFTHTQGFPPKAKDLVEKLLILEPNKRIGNKKKGFEELKSHPFFAEIQWDTLHTQTPPPLKAPEVPLLPPDESSSCGGEGVIDRPLRSSGGGGGGGGRGDDVTHMDLDEQRKTVWGKFLLPKTEEVIVESGAVMKKKNKFLPAARKLQLILTSFPRLFFVDVEKMAQMGEIPWSSDLTVDVKSERFFEIHSVPPPRRLLSPPPLR